MTDKYLLFYFYEVNIICDGIRINVLVFSSGSVSSVNGQITCGGVIFICSDYSQFNIYSKLIRLCRYKIPCSIEYSQLTHVDDKHWSFV